jgi:hypothetical protein
MAMQAAGNIKMGLVIDLERPAMIADRHGDVLKERLESASGDRPAGSPRR